MSSHRPQRHRSVAAVLDLNPRQAVQGLVALALSALLSGCGSGNAVQKAADASSAGAAKGVANTPANRPKSTNVVAESKSVFRVAARGTRDPFFPQLSRALMTSADVPEMPRLPTTSYLQLMGVWPATSRPMALINRTPVTLGEEAEVAIMITNRMNQLAMEKVNVRCLEIRRDSVLVMIDGDKAVKELRMPQRK